MRRTESLRVYIFFVATCLAFLFVAWRLFSLTYVHHAVYARTAEAQSDGSSGALVRGSITFADDSTVAAGTKKFALVSIVASKIPSDRRQQAITDISRITGASRESAIAIVNSKSDFIRTLPEKLSEEQVSAIKNLGIPGVSIMYQTDRFYPNAFLAADVVGFLGYGENGRVGQYGIESFYDDMLSGRAGGFASTVPGIPEFIRRLGGKEQKDPARPDDITLTIDRPVQAFIETQLDALLARWKSTIGSIIVQEPATGKIIALADRPTFDPNDYHSSEPISFLNGSVQQIFEPGSSFKPVTMAVGLDTGKITPQTTYEDTGLVRADGREIKNFDGKARGRQTMTEVLEKSLNTGTMFVENLVGDVAFREYVINMGFGQRTGIDLPGELSGNINNLYSGRKVNYLTASFGQGIAVTPLQLITAYSTIANGGKLMRPYVTQKIAAEGGADTVTKPEVIGIPMSEKTAAKLQTMLTSVVDHGFDKARIPGYDVAGKTGTAQIPDETGGYDPNQVIHSFVGFAPSYNAKFTILIKMDRPQGINFAADSLSPVFREIAAYLLRHYNIPPTRS